MYSPIQHAGYIHFEDDFIFILIADSGDGFFQLSMVAMDTSAASQDKTADLMPWRFWNA